MNRVLLLCCVIGYGALISSCDGNKFKWGTSDKKNIDSLFLGISLGMDQKAFYDHCWELNRQKVFTHGPKNQEVEYMLVNELDQPVIMRFYPSFYEDKIFEMPVLFSYQAWAPWNKEYSADSLLVHMVPVFKKWYGDEFKVVEHPIQGTIYVQMQGKRRINLFKRDDQFVQAVFTDLEREREMKAGDNKDSTN